MARGFKTAKEAALAMGIAVATYTQHEADTRGFPSKRASQYAEFFRCSPEWLLYGRSAAKPDSVPLIGFVGAGAEVHLFPEGHDPRWIPVRTDISDNTRALTIRTPDLGFVLDGWTALYDAGQRHPTPDLHRQLCVVAVGEEDDQERLYLRQLVPAGASLGLTFHLLAPAAPPLLDQHVIWAARVTQLIP